jgi:hypothetical protein
MVDNRLQAGLDSRTVAKSLAFFLNDKSCACSTSMSHTSGMGSGAGTVQKAQMEPYALARGDGRGITRGRDVMRSARCTGARRIFIMSCQAVDASFVIS